MAPRLTPLVDADVDRVESLLTSTLGGRMQARLGRLVDALEGSGLVAVNDAGAPIGVVSWLVGGDDSSAGEAEIRILAVAGEARSRGLGGALMAAAEASLARSRVRRAWLVTTNDNLEALGFYQRRGWRLAELHPGAIDVVRAALKPEISLLAENDIPIRDELVLRKDL